MDKMPELMPTFSAEDMPHETITLRGSGRDDGYLIAHRGFSVVPAGRKNAGKRLIGLYEVSSLEIYVESVPGIFSYDLSLGGPWTSFQGLDGVYHGSNDPVTWPSASAATVSAYLSAYLSEEISVPPVSEVSPSTPNGFYLSDPDYFSGGQYWGASYNAVSSSSINYPAPSRVNRSVKVHPPPKVSVVKSRGERRLALDKDI